MNATTPYAYTMPATPEGTNYVVRSRDGGANTVELERFDPPVSGTYKLRGPLEFFSAFDVEDRHLGTWSPGYPDSGWTKFGGSSHPGRTVYTALIVASLAREGEPVQRKEWARVMEGRRVVTFERVG